MKQWLINASAPFCGTDTVYLAYCDEDPLDIDGVWEHIVDDLWDNYSYLLHLDDDDYETEEDYEEAYDQAYEDWRQDCNIYSEEATDKEIEDNAPGGDINNIEIVIDHRNEE